MTEFETQVLEQLLAIRSLLERREAGETNLLQVIHHHVKDAEFTSSELLAHAALPANADLQTALDCEFGLPNPRRVGKYLAAIAGQKNGGFIAEPIGAERGAILWRVKVCEAKHTAPVAREDNPVMLTARIGRKQKCG